MNVSDLYILIGQSKTLFSALILIINIIIYCDFPFRSFWGRDVIPSPLPWSFRTWSSTHQSTILSPSILSSNQSCLLLPNSCSSLSYLTQTSFCYCCCCCCLLFSLFFLILMSVQQVMNVLLADKLRHNSTNGQLS